MTVPINPSSASSVQTSSVNGGRNGHSESSKSLESSGGNNDDRASISSAAKNIHQANDGATSGLGREQAQQLATDIKVLFSSDSGQALASQAQNIGSNVRELLQQSA